MKLGDIKRTFSHPLNSKRRIFSILNYFKLGIYMRLFPSRMFIHPYVQGTKLLVGKKSTSSTLQYLNSLNDFEEMSLVLHYLDNNDIFIDVGANIGVYSILASGVRKAKSIAIEPSSENLEILKKNLEINRLEEKIDIIQCVVGDSEGNITFTKGLDAINKVLSNDITNENSETLPQKTLDNLLKDVNPTIIKTDVEGYDLKVLQGSKYILAKPSLKIVLVETNGLSSFYGLKEEDIFILMKEFDFAPFTYNPFKRELTELTNIKMKNDNTIFIRKNEFIEITNKIKKSPKIAINNILF